MMVLKLDPPVLTPKLSKDMVAWQKKISKKLGISPEILADMPWDSFIKLAASKNYDVVIEVIKPKKKRKAKKKS